MCLQAQERVKLLEIRVHELETILRRVNGRLRGLEEANRSARFPPSLAPSIPPAPVVPNLEIVNLEPDTGSWEEDRYYGSRSGRYIPP